MLYVYVYCVYMCVRVQCDRTCIVYYILYYCILCSAVVVDLADDKMRNPADATVPFRCVGFSGVRQ